MAKLHENSPDGSIPVTEMEDGDLAVITKWVVSDYVGRIVQRYGGDLLTIGKDSGSGWYRFFTSERDAISCKVRILKPGELIEV